MQIASVAVAVRMVGTVANVSRSVVLTPENRSAMTRDAIGGQEEIGDIGSGNAL